MTEPMDTAEHVDQGVARTRRVRLVVAFAAAAALVAGAVGGGLWLRHGEEFPREDPEFSSVLPPLPRSDTKFSISVPIEDKGKDIEILEVEARTTSNVEYLGAYGIWPRDLDPKQGQPTIYDGYPTGTRSQHPAFGTVVPAAELQFEPEGYGAPGDLFVQAGYRIASGDIGGVNGIKVRYKFGGKTKTQYFRWGAIVCVKPHRCGGVMDPVERPEDDGFRERTYVQLGLVSADEYEN